MLNVELMKFKVKPGKSEVVTEWLQFLNMHMDEVLLTLVDEKMYVETIFREIQGNEEYLYWYSVQGTGGVSVTESIHEIDRKHLEYWEECIDESVKLTSINTEVVMIQKNIQKNMQ